MKHNVLLLHGYRGSVDNHWFPWLAEELAKHGVEVTIPALPAQEETTQEEWLRALEPYKEKITPNTIVVGHSLGAAVMLRWLTTLETSITGAVYVGGFGKPFGERKEDIVCHGFVQDIAWKKLRKTAKQHTVFASMNDPEIPVEVSCHLGAQLQAPMHCIEQAGHFCSDDGYDTFPRLLQHLLDTIYVTYDEFSKMDMRIGEISGVEIVEGSEKLLKYMVDFGDTHKQVVSGIRGYLENPKDIEGKRVLYVTNLTPRMIMGHESQAMLMAIGDEDTAFSFLLAEQDVAPGSRVR